MVFLPTNNGDSWTERNIEFKTTFIINSFVINSNYIFAGTNIGGIYRAKLSDFGITSVNEQEQNTNQINIFPNPATDNFTISIPNNYINNKIGIVNFLGTKVLEIEPQGQTTTINIESLSKGVYFLRIGYETKMFIID